MKLIIISGLSGSGKSTCLHVLEDIGYYCIDNFPTSLLENLVEKMSANNTPELDKVAISVDSRNTSTDLQQFPATFQKLASSNFDQEIIFLDAQSNTLFKRFSETRRKHPLSNAQIGLLEAIEEERELLKPIALLADLTLNTSDLSMHQLRDLIKNRVAEREDHGLALQFESFGFKNGLPIDADMVYDARCLPNPYWVEALRNLNGRDEDIIEYLGNQPEVLEMLDDITNYLERWLPRFTANNRSYLTVAIGCTGGQHRSVFLCEKLKQHFEKSIVNIQVRHRELT